MPKTRKLAVAGVVAGAVGAGVLGAAATPATAATPGPSWIVAGGSSSIYRGQSAVVYGTAGSNHRAAAGMRVALQVSINGRWYAKGVRYADRYGRVSYRFKPAGTSRWRLALVGTPTSVQSYSRILTIRVSRPPARSSRGAQVVAAAARQAGKPYVFAAAGPNAFDCSGLTLYVYRQFGIRLPHSATQQSRYGRAISKSAAMPGDLLFFGRPGAYYHVAIYAGGGYMWEAQTSGVPVGKHRIWSSGYTVRRLV
jgi:cell wall-associated NlpC family hydrolase